MAGPFCRTESVTLEGRCLPPVWIEDFLETIVLWPFIAPIDIALLNMFLVVM